ncbi:MAG: hypothetical protein WCX46_00310 [Candidatus Paceibacterota bacterium]
MLPEKIIYIGILINFIGQVFYIKNIIFGGTRPNLVSWFMWMLAPFIGVFLMLRAGAGLSVLPVFMAGFGPFLVLSFSLFRKNSYWKITTFDLFCGILSLIALVIYVFTKNLGISILFVILSDGLAAIPTIVKSWNFPETETSLIYITGMISNILGLLIITNWIFSIYSLSLYFVFVNIIIVFSIYHKKIFNVKIAI